jgi:hypothetical protein
LPRAVIGRAKAEPPDDQAAATRRRGRPPKQRPEAPSPADELFKLTA